MFAACLLSFIVGFLSLSQEILWVRLFGFANHSLPQAFAFVLMLYLIGIAIGARIGKFLCGGDFELWPVAGFVLLISSLFDVIGPWAYAGLAKTEMQVMGGGFLIALTALLKSIVFPIAHHLGTPRSGPGVGRALSKVYVSNIAGATLGPIVTGMILLDVFWTQQCFALCAGFTFLAGLYCLRGHVRAVTLVASTLAAAVFLRYALTREPYLLMMKMADTLGSNGPEGAIRRMIENKHGIVTIYRNTAGGDIVYGGNVYDGRTNLSPIVNTNGLHRLIILPAIHKNPERVLMVGLSIGSWLKIITTFPGVKHIDVVEINPGYLKAIQNYPPQRNALSDPRVVIYVDDGRRWLRTHPDLKFDLLVMNTTLSWRAYSTNLLSREFLTLMKEHMRPNAVLTYNATNSPDTFKTASVVFPYAYKYDSFVVASDFDWRPRLRDPGAVARLSRLSMDGAPLFPLGSEATIHRFLNESIISIESVEAEYAKSENRPLEIVTDANLLPEYKYGRHLPFGGYAD
jgi:spermidine synthase